jgi:hypothetical protein
LGAAAIWLLGGSNSTDQTDSTAAEPARTESAKSPSTQQAPYAGKGSTPASNTIRRAREPPSHLLRAGATTSWETLVRSTPAQLGLVIAPLGGGTVHAFGPLQTGHAWSTLKVPILTTLMREGSLSPEEEGWSRAALTASDNEAAAALFGKLEAAHRGLDGASRAVEGTLHRAGDGETVVATATPPPGAMSTFGQTEWSLRDSARFLHALGRGCLLDHAGTAYVLDLMEEVVPEQRWGLGEASFSPSWQVSLKGGWGPEGSASGPYLVRQSGILRHGDRGVAVAMIAQADSGSFDAGIEAIGRISAWLAENLASLGPRGGNRC